MRWWRRNRWGLVALPLVVALAWWAGTYRVRVLHAPYELGQPVTSGDDGRAHLVTTSASFAGPPQQIDMTLSAGAPTQVTSGLDSLGQIKAFDRVPGTVVWRVDLTATVSPETDLSACQVRLVDDRGRSTRFASTDIASIMPTNPCVPSATPGPSVDPVTGQAELEEGQGPRPETYTVPVYVRTTTDFEPVRLDVWWDPPRYAALDLSEGS